MFFSDEFITRIVCTPVMTGNSSKSELKGHKTHQHQPTPENGRRKKPPCSTIFPVFNLQVVNGSLRLFS